MVCKTVFGDCTAAARVTRGIGSNGIELAIPCFAAHADPLNDRFADFFDLRGSFASDRFCYSWSQKTAFQ